MPSESVSILSLGSRGNASSPSNTESLSSSGSALSPMPSESVSILSLGSRGNASSPSNTESLSSSGSALSPMPSESLSTHSEGSFGKRSESSKTPSPSVSLSRQAISSDAGSTRLQSRIEEECTAIVSPGHPSLVKQ